MFPCAVADSAGTEMLGQDSGAQVTAMSGADLAPGCKKIQGTLQEVSEVARYQSTQCVAMQKSVQKVKVALTGAF